MVIPLPPPFDASREGKVVKLGQSVPYQRLPKISKDRPTVASLPLHQALIEFVAGEVEVDVWERLATELGGPQSGARGGEDNLRSLIADLGRIADGRGVRQWRCMA